MMKLFTLALLATTAFANSGIFREDGGVVQPRGVVDQPAFVGRDTNAKRLARGLAPIAPRARWSQTRALKPRVSGTPSCPPLTSAKGIIKVSRPNGSLLGYIRNTFDSQNSYTYGPIGQALSVTLPSLSPFNTPIDIGAFNGGPDPAHPFVGAVGGSAGYNFNPGQLGYAYLAGTGDTPANSPPSSSAGTSIQSIGYNAPAESQIWTLSCSLSLTAQWTNTDGSQPATSIFYDGAVDFVGLIGDFNKFTTTFPGENAELVTLSFVPT